MKKREFFKRLLGITAAAVVAPKVLLAEETPKEVVVGDSRSFNGLYEPSTLTTGSGNTDERVSQITDYSRVLDVKSCNGSSAEVYCNNNLPKVGDVIDVWRDGKIIGLFSMVTQFVEFPKGEIMIRLSCAKRGELDVKKGDFLVRKANAYAENSPKTKK